MILPFSRIDSKPEATDGDGAGAGAGAGASILFIMYNLTIQIHF